MSCNCCDCCENPSNLIEVENAQSDHGAAGIYQKYYCAECHEIWWYYDDELERQIEAYEEKHKKI